MLEIENVSLKKGTISVLTHINCEMQPNEIVAILGKSGSGKTSLLRCLAQIEDSYTGKISLNRQPLASLPSKQRGRSIGFVPQSYALFPHMTILENCICPLQVILDLERKEAIAKAKNILSSLGMEPWIEAYPHALSGGQQQRVAIARALALDPLFLFLDEPTSALDPENVGRLIAILKLLKQKGKGIVISSQDMAFASKVSDRVLLIEEGRIIETAAKEDRGLLSGKIGELLGAL
jgi:polar amino acid transport system ATP-binding protein